MNAATQSGLVPCDKLRILITDDEAPVRNIFRMILADGFPSCTFDQASNGAEAVECFRQHHHALALMDLKMPVMDGQTAFYKIRDLCDEKGWELPAVIFCTGFSPSPGLVTLTSSGQTHSLLRKPVTSEMLLEAVKSHLPPA